MSRSRPLKSIRRLTKAWIQKDSHTMSRLLSEDITEIGPAFETPLIGKKSFFSKYRKYLNSTLRIESYKILRPKVMELSPKFSLVHFRYRMRTVDNGVAEESRGKESMLVEKVGTHWLVKFIHWHRDEDT